MARHVHDSHAYDQSAVAHGNGSQNPARSQHGVRPVRESIFIEQLMVHVGSGQRLEILRVLSSAQMNVSAIANALFLKVNAVSRDLAILQSCGMVSCSRNKNNRIYRLTERVRVLRKGELMQLVILNDEGRWILINVDETGNPDHIVPPPDTFVHIAQG